MGVPQAMEALRERAALVRESLQKSQTITESMVSILGSFDHRLSALETAMRPTQIRTHSIRIAHENIDKTLKAAESILAQFDLTRKAEAKILRGPHEDLESYLQAIDQLRSNIQFFSNHKSFKSSDGILNHANNLLAKAISKLEDEFRALLTNYSKPVEPDRLFDGLPNSLRPSATSPGKQGDHGSKNHSENQKNLENAVYMPPTLIPPRVLPLLHDLAQQMVQAGHQQQLFRIYRDTRASVLEQSLRKLGVERLSKDDVQKMQWEVLEAKIGNWIHYMRISVKLLFAGEKKICDQILDGIDSLRDQCFAEVTANSVSILLSFGEAIARSKRSPEKLFVLLDMYEIMRELQSEIEFLFGSKSYIEMWESAQSLTKRLAQTAQETFVDFEEAVERDATKTAVLDGTVHPLTSYVINYVKFLFDYQSTLKQLFQEFDDGDGEVDADAQLTNVTTRIMQALQTNLDGKSKQYKDPALTQLFLMNNIHYIVRSVRRSEAKDLLGDDWVQIHRRIVQQHANQYKRISWAKILQCLTIQGAAPPGGGGGGLLGGDSGSGVSRAMVKDRFKTFNVQFEDLHLRQSQWTVPDSELRESLRLAVAEVLLPAYRSFIKRFGAMIENGKTPGKYIRYTPEDLERMLSEFFEGKTWNEQKR
ncbi:exocyst complex component EXO70A1-like isoform X1 [Durio zibethinus]|uniref:Exocyst subunit Exo70 family protein n=1 Tax=Durio zibethinus TaxID=66656 RepID=A0A6P5YV96_DURZI|nr:exocyst complex component EXO70A1-like isoform X1 [Durio zibethinus]